MTKIKVSNYLKYVLMQLEGNFNSEDDAERIRETFKEIAKDDNVLVLVDLKEVHYLNSASLGAFLSGIAVITKVGGKMVLFNANEYLDNIFQITRLKLSIPIYSSLEEAIQYLESKD